MNRDRFIKQLEKLLMDIPEEERREAISYYEDYFDDAGEEKEEAVLTELGSPERVARSIKAELQGNAMTGGFTEKGYEEFQEREVPAKRGAEDSNTGKKDTSDLRTGNRDTSLHGTAEMADKSRKKAEYHGPFEYNQHQNQQHSQSQYKYRNNYAGNGEDGSARNGQQNKYGKQYQTRHNTSRRPIWATVLLLFAGIVVIVALATAFGICGIVGVACLAAGIGIAVFAAPAVGIATVGISFIFLAIFVIALLAEILFCKHVMPDICNGRRGRS